MGVRLPITFFACLTLPSASWWYLFSSLGMICNREAFMAVNCIWTPSPNIIIHLINISSNILAASVFLPLPIICYRKCIRGCNRVQVFFSQYQFLLDRHFLQNFNASVFLPCIRYVAAMAVTAFECSSPNITLSFSQDLFRHPSLFLIC